MRRSTKTSSRHVALLPILLVTVLLCCGVEVRAAPILSEVAVGMAGQGEAQTRRLALHAALAEAVKALVVRHVPSDQRVERAKEIRSAYLNRPEPFVSRYTVVSEGAEQPDAPANGSESPSARYRIAVRAEIDQDKLLTDLYARNFEVRTLPVLPRLLIACTDDPASRLSMEVVRLRFEQEGFAVHTRIAPVDESGGSVLETPRASNDADALRANAQGTPLPVEQWARNAGAHVAMVIRTVSGEEGEAAALETIPARVVAVDGEAPEGKAEASPMVVAVSMVATGWGSDARTGQLLCMGEASYIGRDIDPEEAARKGIRQAAERLFQTLMVELVQSGWTMGVALERLEVRVGGLDSPALVEKIEAALSGLAEFDSVVLVRVETKAAVWEVEAVQSDYDWQQLLSGLTFKGGEVAWRVPLVMVPLGNVGKPEAVRVEGQWLAQ